MANAILATYKEEIVSYVRAELQSVGEQCDLRYSSLEVNYFPLPYISLVDFGFSRKTDLTSPFTVSAKEVRAYLNPLEYLNHKAKIVTKAVFVSPSFTIDSSIVGGPKETQNKALSEGGAGEDHVEYNLLKGLEIGEEVRDLFNTDFDIREVSVEDGTLSFASENLDETFTINEIHLSTSATLENSILNVPLLDLSAQYVKKESVQKFSLKLSSQSSLEKNILVSDWKGEVSLREGIGNNFFLSPFTNEITFLMDGNFIRPQHSRIAFSGGAKEGFVGLDLSLKEFVFTLDSVIPENGFNGAKMRLLTEFAETQVGDKNIRIDNISFNSSIKSRQKGYSMSITDSSFSLQKKPISIQKINLASSLDFKNFTFDDVDLDVAKQSFNLDGSYDSSENILQTSLKSRDVNISELNTFLNLLFPSPLPKDLKAVSDLDLELTVGDEVNSAKGSLTLHDVDAPSFNFVSKKLSFKNFNFKTKSWERFDFDTEIGAVRFSLLLDNDRYKLASGAGHIKAVIEENGAANAVASLMLDDFGYNDGNVKITKVDTKINDIKITVAEDTRVDVSLLVDGDDIMLKTADIDVQRVRSVRGPVYVYVGAKKGYSVKGTANVIGGKTTLFERPLEKVGGAVDFEITSPIKTFKTKSLFADINNETLRAIHGDFTMDKERYHLKQSILKIFGGSLGLDGFLSREQKAVACNIEMHNVDTARILHLLKKEDRPLLTGTIDSFKANLTTDKKNLLPALKGEGYLSFKDGELKQLPLDSSLESTVIEAIESVKKSKAEDAESTKVEKLELYFKVDNGVVSSKSIEMAGRFYTFKGKGKYTFGEGFDIPGAAVFAERTVSEIGGPVKILRKLIGSIARVEIPVHIKGPVEDVEVETDPSRLLSVLSPGRAVKKVGQGVGSFFQGIKDVVVGRDDEP